MVDFTNPNDFWAHRIDPYKGMSDGERMRAGCLNGLSFFIVLLIALAICALLGSCTTTKYIPIEHHTIDTLKVTQYQRDSIYVKDSTVTDRSGDTITIEHWHVEWSDRILHDTVYKSRIDSVPAPYPVEVKVPAELTWWQQTRIHLANILLWLLLICGVCWILKKKFLS